MDYNFVKLERFVNLREVWPHEAHHFTHWVADEGLELLSEEIGLKGIIEPVCEVQIVGNKRIDIVAKEKESGKEVIIENQLEATNHDHLGKIVTYAASRQEAAIVIWIVAKATDEHRKAVEWLNRRTDNNIDFYLVEIQLWKIEQSHLLPRFNVIERPAPKEIFRELSESDKFFVNFWTEFNRYADSIPHKFFSPENFNAKRKPYPQGSYDLHVNGFKNAYVFYVLLKSKKSVKCGIYLPDDKDLFLRLKANSQEIANAFGSEVEWNYGSKKASSVCVSRECNDLEGTDSQNILFEWMCETALKWKDFMVENCRDMSRLIQDLS